MQGSPDSQRIEEILDKVSLLLFAGAALTGLGLVLGFVYGPRLDTILKRTEEIQQRLGGFGL